MAAGLLGGATPNLTVQARDVKCKCCERGCYFSCCCTGDSDIDTTGKTAPPGTIYILTKKDKRTTCPVNARLTVKQNGDEVVLEAERTTKATLEEFRTNQTTVSTYYDNLVESIGPNMVAIITAWQSIDFVDIFNKGKPLTIGTADIMLHCQELLVRKEKIKKTFDFVMGIVDSFYDNSRDAAQSVVEAYLKSHGKTVRHTEETKTSRNNSANSAGQKTSSSPRAGSVRLVEAAQSEDIGDVVEGAEDLKNLFLTVADVLTGLKAVDITTMAIQLRFLARGPKNEERPLTLQEFVASHTISRMKNSDATKIITIINTVHTCWRKINERVTTKVSLPVTLQTMARTKGLRPSLIPYKAPGELTAPMMLRTITGLHDAERSRTGGSDKKDSR